MQTCDEQANKLCKWEIPQKMKYDHVFYCWIKQPNIVSQYLCHKTVVSLWLVIPRPLILSREISSLSSSDATALRRRNGGSLRSRVTDLDAGLDWAEKFQRILLDPAGEKEISRKVWTTTTSVNPSVGLYHRPSYCSCIPASSSGHLSCGNIWPTSCWCWATTRPVTASNTMNLGGRGRVGQVDLPGAGGALVYGSYQVSHLVSLSRRSPLPSHTGRL